MVCSQYTYLSLQKLLWCIRKCLILLNFGLKTPIKKQIISSLIELCQCCLHNFIRVNVSSLSLLSNWFACCYVIQTSASQQTFVWLENIWVFKFCASNLYKFKWYNFCSHFIGCTMVNNICIEIGMAPVSIIVLEI